jgi:hypothetical protein
MVPWQRGDVAKTAPSCVKFTSECLFPLCFMQILVHIFTEPSFYWGFERIVLFIRLYQIIEKLLFHMCQHLSYNILAKLGRVSNFAQGLLYTNVNIVICGNIGIEGSTCFPCFSWETLTLQDRVFVQLEPSLKVNPKSWFGPNRNTKVTFHTTTNQHPHKLFSQKGLSKYLEKCCVNLLNQNKMKDSQTICGSPHFPIRPLEGDFADTSIYILKGIQWDFHPWIGVRRYLVESSTKYIFMNPFCLNYSFNENQAVFVLFMSVLVCACTEWAEHFFVINKESNS